MEEGEFPFHLPRRPNILRGSESQILQTVNSQDQEKTGEMEVETIIYDWKSHTNLVCHKQHSNHIMSIYELHKTTIKTLKRIMVGFI